MRVAVTGIGIVSPFGNGIAPLWATLVPGAGCGGPEDGAAADSAASAVGETSDARGGGEWVPSEERYFSRNTREVTAACLQALADARLAIPERPCPDWGIVLGSAFGNQERALQYHRKALLEGDRALTPMDGVDCLPVSPLNYAAIRVRAGGPNMHVSSGMASGLDAIGEAYLMVETAQASVVLAGGFDYVHEEMLAVLRARGLLTAEVASRPLDTGRSGLRPGEGSAVLVLEALDHAAARGARLYGEVLGYGNDFEPRHDRCLLRGEGSWRAMAGALEQAGLEAERLDYICAGANGSEILDAAEVSAIGRLLRSSQRDVALSSIKGTIGECFAASGPFQCIATLLAFDRGWLPPTRNLLAPIAGSHVDYVNGEGRPQAVRFGLSNNIDCFGFNASVLLSSPPTRRGDG